MMARRSSYQAKTRGNSGVKKSPLLPIALIMCGIVVVSIVIWWMITPSGYQFQRAHLEKYEALTRKQENLLNDGFSVYVDMSDGMLSAYSATKESKEILKAVINRLVGNGNQFFELSIDRITENDMSHNELYNYMMNPRSYAKQQAPIEKALTQITENNQPALLMSDFEEYNGKTIQKAAYAKKYFINWLKKGYCIIFYSWSFVENGKNKRMFFAVFDDNAKHLNELVEDAIGEIDPNIEKYVLGGKNFTYPTSTQYISSIQGGNYHDSKGFDRVTAVLENGSNDAYKSYDKVEYYPFGVTWADAISNAREMSSTKDPFSHLFSRLFIDFGAQNGYSISEIGVDVFDMQKIMNDIGNALDSGGTISPENIDAINNHKVNTEVVVASMQQVKGRPGGWNEVFIDFAKKFNGQIPNGNSSNLLRADIIIAKAEPNMESTKRFFKWDNNSSLADAVIETLKAPDSQPEGCVLYTYYIKASK